MYFLKKDISQFWPSFPAHLTSIFFLLPTFNEIGSQPHHFSMSLELLAVLHLLSLIKCPWLSNWNGSSQSFWNCLILLEILKSFIWSRWLCSITPSLALCFDESNQPTTNGDLKRIVDSKFLTFHFLDTNYWICDEIQTVQCPTCSL